MGMTNQQMGDAFESNQYRLYWINNEELWWILNARADPTMFRDFIGKTFVDVPKIPASARFVRLIVEHDPSRIGVVYCDPSFDPVPPGEKMPQFPNRHTTAWVLTREQIERASKSEIKFKEFL